MKHSILLTSIGLCLFSFACGSADNSATAGDSAAAGPQWLPSAEVGDGGSSAGDDDADDVGTENNVVESTSEDLSLPGSWTIQLPNNTAASASSDHKPWYYTSGSSKVYSDPTVGTTTSGSKHCRTEMRENKTWKASGTNSMTVTGKVTKGSSGITIGQVFNDNDSIPLAELQWTGSKFNVLYEEAKGGSDGSHPLTGSTGVGKAYTYTMSLTKGVLTVKIEGGGTYTRKPTSKVSGHNFYFKVGNYDQNSTGSSTSKVSSSIRSTVEVSALSVTHN